MCPLREGANKELGGRRTGQEAGGQDLRLGGQGDRMSRGPGWQAWRHLEVLFMAKQHNFVGILIIYFRGWKWAGMRVMSACSVLRLLEMCRLKCCRALAGGAAMGFCCQPLSCCRSMLMRATLLSCQRRMPGCPQM